MTEISGQEAILDAQKPFNMPNACCRCGQPSTQKLTSAIQVTGLGRKTRSVTFPYCKPCFDRAATITRTRSVLYLTCIVLGIVLGMMGLVVPALPRAMLIMVPVALGIFASIVLRARAGDTVDAPRGAWLTKATSKQTTFFMSNAEWAKSFAAANQIASMAPVVKKEASVVWPFALFFCGVAATVVAICVQPAVYIDNEGKAPLQIWIDGKKSVVVEPIHEQLATRPSVNVPFGKHHFGWSAVGAAAPTAQTDGKIEFAGDHLYNPGQSACYFLELSAYGKDETVNYLTGPVPLGELYTFKHVDKWFAENPASVSTKQSSEVRTALKPFRVCQEYMDRGCPQVRAPLLDCLQSAYAQDAAKEVTKQCFATAEHACR